MKTILLTGATGFLGSHLLRALLKNNYKVIILKRSTSDIWRIKKLLNQGVVIYDVNMITLDKIFLDNDIDIIIHLATLYSKLDDNVDIKGMFEVNITLPSQLLELGVEYGIKCFINTGTFFEYECLNLPIAENSKIKPLNLYSKTKIAFESILKQYSNKITIRTLRIFSPYGEKDNDKLIPMIIQKALKCEKIFLSDGLQKLDFIFVSDVINAYLGVLESIDSRYNYRIYNIGSGNTTSVREIVSIVEQQLEKNIDKVWSNPIATDRPVVIADIKRAKKELNWQPEISIHQGISKTIKYYRRFSL